MIQWFDIKDKQLVITNGEGVFSKPVLPDQGSLTPCNHEEADSRMLLHASDAAQHCQNKMLIKTVDTDVVVLTMLMAQLLQPDKMWVAFGIDKGLQYLAAHAISAELGPEKAQAFLMFNVLAGYDTVSSFAGHKF